jgi:hypothetical protein
MQYLDYKQKHRILNNNRRIRETSAIQEFNEESARSLGGMRDVIGMAFSPRITAMGMLSRIIRANTGMGLGTYTAVAAVESVSRKRNSRKILELLSERLIGGRR